MCTHLSDDPNEVLQQGLPPLVCDHSSREVAQEVGTRGLDGIQVAVQGRRLMKERGGEGREGKGREGREGREGEVGTISLQSQLVSVQCDILHYLTPSELGLFQSSQHCQIYLFFIYFIFTLAGIGRA